MRISRSVLILLAGAALAPLAACKVDNRPLLARGEPEPAAYAALPQPGAPYEAPPPPTAYGAYPPGYAAGGYAPARRIAYAPDRAWPYAEQAWGLDQALYDIPPDYAFAYGGEEPWVWQTADDSLMFAEPYGDAYRFYYYEPGAAYPYFVQDPNYGYAYGGDGALIALYTAAGALLSADSYDSYWPQASQYWTRGYDLHQAYGGGRRYAVDSQAWAQRAPVLTRVQQTWVRAGETEPAWRDWRARSGEDFAARYAPERARHMQIAQQRFAVAGPVPGDNGRHLGWMEGRHEGWRNGGGPPLAAGGAAPGPRPEPGRMRMAEARLPQVTSPPVQALRAEHLQAERGRGWAPSNAVQAGREAAFRGPEAHAQSRPAPQPAVQGGGDHGHGGWRGGEPRGGPPAAESRGQAFARQSFHPPEPAPPHAEQHLAQAAAPPGGGWHGGGGGQPQRAAAAAPQPPAQHPQGGQGGGHGQGQGNGNDKHGHGG